MPYALKISALIILLLMTAVLIYNTYSISIKETLAVQTRLQDQNKNISILISKYENFNLKYDLCASQLSNQFKLNEKIKKLETDLIELKASKEKLIQETDTDALSVSILRKEHEAEIKKINEECHKKCSHKFINKSKLISK